MKTLQVWSIEVWDGGDRHNHKFYLGSQEAADAYKAQHQFDLVVPKELVIFDSPKEYEEAHSAELAAKAFAKLSDLERSAITYQLLTKGKL